MTGSLRLLRIQTRRSIGLWFFPVMAGMAGLYAAQNITFSDVTLWSRSSIQIGLMLEVLMPLIAGVAAWAAGRDRRRGIDDLLATTPRSPVTRELTGWASTLAWGLFAYLAAAAYIIVLSIRDATWGGPNLWPVLIGMLAVITGAAIGWAAGTLVKSRFVALIVPIALYFVSAMLSPGAPGEPAGTLFPARLLHRGLYLGYDAVFYGVSYDYWWNALLWLAGLTGIALGAVALHYRRTIPVWSTIGAAMLVAGVGAGTLLDADGSLPADDDREEPVVIAYQPTCVKRSISVCLHPAFEDILDPLADRIGLLVEPLLGIPGAPVRAEQLPEIRTTLAGLRPDGTLDIELHSGPLDSTLREAAMSLVLQEPLDDEPPTPDRSTISPWAASPVQVAVVHWLLARVDENAVERSPHYTGTEYARTRARIDAAVERFDALDPFERRAWFKEHYRDLRAGRLTLEDLP